MIKNINDIIATAKSDIDLNISFYEFNYVLENVNYIQESVGESLKNLWEKVKKWFSDLMRSIKNFFSSSKSYNKNVDISSMSKSIKSDPKIRDQEIKVIKCKPIKESINSIKYVFIDLKNISKEKDIKKDEIFSKIKNLKEPNKEGLMKLIKSFVIEDEETVVKLGDINLDLYKEYVSGEKDILDTINKERATLESMIRDKLVAEDDTISSEQRSAFEAIISLSISITQVYTGHVMRVVKNGNQLIGHISKLTKSSEGKNNQINNGIIKILKEKDRSDIEGLRSTLTTIIQNDPAFERNSFNDAITYLNMDDLIFEKHDDSIPLISSKKSSGFTDDDYVDAVYNLKKNFSKNVLKMLRK